MIAFGINGMSALQPKRSNFRPAAYVRTMGVALRRSGHYICRMGIDWRLAEALAIQKRQGDAAPAWVAERLRALATARDTAGVERFREIAARLHDLTTASRH